MWNSNGSKCVSVFYLKRPQAPLSSPRLLASEAHMGCSLYLFPQVFRPIEWRPFCRIRGPVRHYILVVALECCCQINRGIPPRLKRCEAPRKTTCRSAENQRLSQHWLREETARLQPRLAYSPRPCRVIQITQLLLVMQTNPHRWLRLVVVVLEAEGASAVVAELLSCCSRLAWEFVLTTSHQVSSKLLRWSQLD